MRQGLGGSTFLMSFSGPENVYDHGYLLSKLQHGDSLSTQASLMAYPRPLCRSIEHGNITDSDHRLCTRPDVVATTLGTVPPLGSRCS